MARKIFVNLPVQDLDRSIGFFERLGFSPNPQFTDETAACIVISDEIYAMLLTEAKFREFTSKEIADATRTAEVLVALSADSRKEADRLAEAAIAAGGREARPAEDHGFMYGRSFEDPDGHIWEVFWMNPAHLQQ